MLSVNFYDYFPDLNPMDYCVRSGIEKDTTGNTKSRLIDRKKAVFEIFPKKSVKSIFFEFWRWIEILITSNGGCFE